VWFRAMYMRLAIQCPSYECARQQLKRHGARHCTAEERQLLLTLPDLPPAAVKPTTLVVSISAAFRWLRAHGERQAADQLSQHQRPVLAPVPAAARNKAAQQGRTGVAAADQRAACVAGVDLHDLLPADSNPWQVSRRTRARAAVPAGLHLDTAALTAVGGAVCRVPILRPAGSRAGLVWAKALYKGLEMERRQPWYVAVQDLKQLGGRICSVAERRVLETFLSVYEDVIDTALIRVDADVSGCCARVSRQPPRSSRTRTGSWLQHIAARQGTCRRRMVKRRTRSSQQAQLIQGINPGHHALTCIRLTSWPDRRPHRSTAEPLQQWCALLLS